MADPEKQASSVATPEPEREHQHHGAVVIPDGGRGAWCTVVGAWLVLFSTFGFAYAFGVFEDYYVRVYLTRSSPSSIAWIGSVQYMLPYFLAPIVGQYFDDGGFHKLQISGAVVFTFSVFMLSLAQENQYYQIFLAQGVGMGLGLALTFLPSVTIVFHHFHRHRGLASGLVLSGSSIGAAVFPVMLKYYILPSPWRADIIFLPATSSPRLGFANALRACGSLIPPCLLAGNLLMRTRTRLPPHKTPNPLKKMRAFLVDVPYMWAVLGIVLGFTGLYFPVVYIQLLSLQHGISPSLAFYSVTMLNAFGTVFRLLGTHWGDVYGPLRVQIVCCVGAGVMIFAMLALKNAASLVILSLLYGSFYSTWLALGFPCTAALAKGPEEIGARGGIGLVFGSIGTLISTPIQGALLTRDFYWIRPIAFSATMVLASGAAFGVALYLHQKRVARRTQTQNGEEALAT
ncbi:hypothetical protein MKEN_00548400 [Mycena kentingensis (nom. inval.)]|nr:hypothetical protein MKEN_00548400 [Mycena kentingensis (nom. inval.)]